MQTALVTGASGGIGLELAKALAAKGYHLVLVARSEGKLKELAAALSAQHGIRATVIAADLGQASAPQAVFDAVSAQGIEVDVLVNNAGFATYGHFVELPPAREVEMVQLNIAALVHLTGLFLPGMKQRGKGRVLNVASTAAFQPGPLMATYYATKAFVLSFSEALAEELRGTGVTITALCPGPTESGFQQRAAMQDSKLVASGGLMGADVVAGSGVAAMEKGQTVVVPGLMNRIMTLLPRLLPRGMVTRTVMNMQQRTGH